MFYVYIYRRPATNEPFYVGKGVGRRWRDHLRGHGSNRWMQSVLKNMRIAGIEPMVELISCIDEQHAYLLEECLVDVIGRRSEGTGPLLNLAEGGRGGALGVRRSEETKSKIRDSRLGRGIPHTASTRQRMSETHKGMPGPNLGRKFGPRPRVCCITCKRDVTVNTMPQHLAVSCIQKEI